MSSVIEKTKSLQAVRSLSKTSCRSFAAGLSARCSCMHQRKNEQMYGRMEKRINGRVDNRVDSEEMMDP